MMEYNLDFTWLLSTSIEGIFLVGVILFCKTLFKDKMGARWHYYIWFLLLLKLLLPVLPQTSISIFNWFNFHEPATAITRNIIAYSPETIISWFGQGFSETHGMVADSGVLSGEGMSIVTMLWLTGVIMLTLITVGINMKFFLRIRKSEACKEETMVELLENCKSEIGVNKRIALVKSKDVLSPSLYGFFRPCVLLPVDIENKLNEGELRHVMLHELAHVKRKDIAIYWVTGFVKIIHWFNPVVWYGFYQMRQDGEVACDALVLSYIGDEERISYGETIIHSLENMRKTFQPAGVAGVYGSKSQLKRRINMISKFEKNTYKLSIASMIVLLLVGGVFLTGAKVSSAEALLNESNQVQVDLLNEPNQEQSDLTKETSTPVDLKASGLGEEAAFSWPVPDSTSVTTPYGKRKHPVTGEEKMHTGIDIEAEEGMTIIAASDGTVVQAGELGGYGQAIIIDHGDGIATLYGHCSEMLVEEGSTVKAGESIGTVGNTGLTTRPNLHFEVRQDGESVDPYIYLEQ